MTAKPGVAAALTLTAALGALALAGCGRSSPDSRTGPDTAPQNTVSSTGSGGPGAADSSAAQQGASSAATPPAGGNQPNSQ